MKHNYDYSVIKICYMCNPNKTGRGGTPGNIGVWLPVSEFNGDVNKPGGMRTNCKYCDRARAKERHLKTYIPSIKRNKKPAPARQILVRNVSHAEITLNQSSRSIYEKHQSTQESYIFENYGGGADISSDERCSAASILRSN